MAAYPSGTGPPTQRPLRLEAAILSRTRSPISSRSNWANDSRTLSVSRPMLELVLKDWVTDTNETPWASNSSMSLAKSASERVSRSTGECTIVVAAGDQPPAFVHLVHQHNVDSARPDIGQELLQRRPVERGRLALYIGLAGLALGGELKASSRLYSVDLRV